MRKRVKLEGLTECQTETLMALGALNRRSSAFQTVDEVARQRLSMRFYDGTKARSGSYFGMYLTTTQKMLEELTRKGYVDQSEKSGKKETRMLDKRPYKITKKGKTKLAEV